MTPLGAAPDSPPPRSCCRLSGSAKGLLAALLGGALPAGFVAPFARLAHDASGMPSLELLLFRCLLPLGFAWPLRRLGAPLLGPPPARRRLLCHALAHVLSVACAYSSYLALPTAHAATVRKGSCTLGAAVLALCVGARPLTGDDWLGLGASAVGLLVTALPELPGAGLREAFGYGLAGLGGLALALALVALPALDCPARLTTTAFAFGAVGTAICAPALLWLQEPVVPQAPLAWVCTAGVACLALASSMSAGYAVTAAPPALVCAALHTEVAVTLVLQRYLLLEPVAPGAVAGAGVVLGAMAAIAARQAACPAPGDEGQQEAEDSGERLDGKAGGARGGE
ncbi:solute carrier family 35 member G5-like [Alligator mississippiensis]|uniref:solute carrier family 35 member G5-like n=1 Tax=Alligator mississippiensis TaxID=8496 RepID=UPI002877AD8E|nr:solute carrier family 35 member G5-like [Alligator mississippiensis]